MNILRGEGAAYEMSEEGRGTREGVGWGGRGPHGVALHNAEDFHR